MSTTISAPAAAPVPSSPWTRASAAALVSVCGASYRVIRTVRRLSDDYWSNADYEALCNSALFEVFVDLGGDPEIPEAFAWAARHDEIVMAAATRVKRVAARRGSLSFDIDRRLQVRRAATPSGEWDAWGDGDDSDHGAPPTDHARTNRGARCVTARRLVTSSSAERDVARALHDEQLTQFIAELQQLLTPLEYRIIHARFVDHIDRQTLVDQLIAEAPERHQDPGARKRVENRIDTITTRARRRAAKQLNPRWRAVAQEVVAS